VSPATTRASASLCHAVASSGAALVARRASRTARWVYAAGGLGQAAQQLQPAAHATPRGDARSVEQPALDADASSLSGTDVNPELIVLTRRKAKHGKQRLWMHAVRHSQSCSCALNIPLLCCSHAHGQARFSEPQHDSDPLKVQKQHAKFWVVDLDLAATQMRPTRRGRSEQCGRTNFHSHISPGSLPFSWPTAAGDDSSPHLKIFALRERALVRHASPLPESPRGYSKRG